MSDGLLPIGLFSRASLLSVKALRAYHEAAMQARLDEVTRIVGELQQGVERPGDHTPVHVRDEPGCHTLAVRGEVAESRFAEWLGEAYATLGALCEQAGIAPAGPVGALYPGVITDEAAEPIEAYVPIGAPIPLPESETPDTERFRTEIHWPITPEEESTT